MTRFVVGWDIAQAIDFSAICVAEVVHIPSDELEAVPGSYGQTRDGRVIPITRRKTRRGLQIRHLDRMQQGLSFPDQVAHVVGLVNSEPLKSADTVLVVDCTGLGAPVCDLLEMSDIRADLAMVTITGGDAESRDGYRWHVPKATLVGAIQVMLAQQRLKIASELPLASVLTDELGAFEIKISQAGRASYSAPSGQHDDALMALALCCWYGGDEAQTEFW